MEIWDEMRRILTHILWICPASLPQHVYHSHVKALHRMSVTPHLQRPGDIAQPPKDQNISKRTKCIFPKMVVSNNYWFSYLKWPCWVVLGGTTILGNTHISIYNPWLLQLDFLSHSAQQSTFEMLCQKKTCRKKTSRSSSQIQGHGSSWGKDG